MITLEQFWDACDRIERDRGTEPNCALHPAGIYLVRPLERYDYYCTPTNSLTFAHTGMDGEHFGFLVIEGSELGAQPVVMTVPMAFSDDRIDSYVIAQDLEEFLRLGCRAGWWMLPSLLMNGPDCSVFEHYQNTAAMDDPEGNAVLEELRNLLGLTPAPLERERLAALDARYGPMIELPPFRPA